MDKITQQRIELLHPKIKDEVFALVTKCDAVLSGRAKMRIVQGLRTFEEQNILYAQGRTNKKLPKVTNAKGGQSYHNYGLAIDFCLIIDGKEVSWDCTKDYDADNIADWMEVVNVFVKADFFWGKAFNDLPHLEKRFGLSYTELLIRYNNKQFIAGTKYVII